MRRVHYKGVEAMNLRKGLEAARDMINFNDRPNVKKVVIVFTNKHEDCTYQQEHAELYDCSFISFKQKMKKPDEDENPCRIASYLVENGVIVFTVALKYDGAQDYPKVNLGTNCYCLKPYVQYSHDDRCIEYGECLYVYGQSESYDVAEETCADAKSSFVDVFSHDKELFIDVGGLDDL
ncbi:unnamed protein product [Anisakis simplex]|uniref:VWFA domain-containing protein n=1 Tax=Anisakis simplex TaxID=6269 RepID=A0A0M3J5M2_ANISI|nr:unnamed protein product [Anisakis simplex]